MTPDGNALSMSKIARWAICAAVVATVVLEVLAYYHYRNAIDGIFVNLAVAIYGLIAIAVIWVADRVVRHIRRRPVHSQP